ncbi:hypothetical protein M0R72_03330 [Candidatus Pacearchaeota archaeon]|nr:hypothetical protein [Candidatus Pacearchaeota archaeon]
MNLEGSAQLINGIGQSNLYSEENTLRKELSTIDILTDFDDTYIRENSAILAVINYFLASPNPLRFLKNTVKGGLEYLEKKDLHSLFYLLKGCPMKLIYGVAKQLHINEEWEQIINSLGIKSVGIVSRNDYGIILKSLASLDEGLTKKQIILANKLQTYQGNCTGDIDVIIDDTNLGKKIKESGKDYICRQQEEKILEKAGLYPKKVKSGFYIYEKRKIF